MEGYIPGEITVHCDRRYACAKSMERRLKKFDLSIKERILYHMYTVQVPHGSEEKWVHYFEQVHFVLKAYRNIHRPPAPPRPTSTKKINVEES